MTGTPSQIERAEQIKLQVSAEFDRVARALMTAAGGRKGRDRIDTLAVIAILEDKRSEVLAKDQAAYFIKEWQELNGQVRHLIAEDTRYQAIKAYRDRLKLEGTGPAGV